MSFRNTRKVVRCIETNELFPSLGAAAKAKGVSVSNLCRLIKYNIPGVCGGCHWEEIEVLPNISHSCPVVCLENKQEFESIATAAKTLNVSRQCVSAAIKNGHAIKGYHFKKVEEPTRA